MHGRTGYVPRHLLDESWLPTAKVAANLLLASVGLGGARARRGLAALGDYEELRRLAPEFAVAAGRACLDGTDGRRAARASLDGEAGASPRARQVARRWGQGSG